MKAFIGMESVLMQSKRKVYKGWAVVIKGNIGTLSIGRYMVYKSKTFAKACKLLKTDKVRRCKIVVE